MSKEAKICIVAIILGILGGIALYHAIMFTGTKPTYQPRYSMNEEIVPNKGAINYGNPNDSWRYAYGDLLIEETKDYYIYEGQYGTYKVLK